MNAAKAGLRTLLLAGTLAASVAGGASLGWMAVVVGLASGLALRQAGSGQPGSFYRGLLAVTATMVAVLAVRLALVQIAVAGAPDASTVPRVAQENIDAAGDEDLADEPDNQDDPPSDDPPSDDPPSDGPPSDDSTTPADEELSDETSSDETSSDETSSDEATDGTSAVNAEGDESPTEETVGEGDPPGLAGDAASAEVESSDSDIAIESPASISPGGSAPAGPTTYERAPVPRPPFAWLESIWLLLAAVVAFTLGRGDTE